MELYGAAVLFFHSPADVGQSCRQPIEDLVLKGTEGAFYVGVGGQGVADGAALKFSEFQQSKHRTRQFFLHFHGFLVEFHGSHQSVHTLIGLGDVGGFSVNVHVDLTGTGHQLLPSAGDDSRFQPRPQVQAENGFDVVLGEYTAFADVLRPAGGLLGALEYQKDIVWQMLLFLQPPGQLQKNCHVPVVAAGVHTAGMTGGIVHTGFFHDGQRVRIRPKGDGILLPKVKPGAQTAVHRFKQQAVQVR